MKEKLITLTGLGRYKEKFLAKVDTLGYITNSVNNLVNYYLKSETYNVSEVNNLIAAIRQFEYVKLDTAIENIQPSASTMFKIYLVPASSTGHESASDNARAEYITIESGSGTQIDPYEYSWEKIGDTEIDLSNLATEAEMNRELANYVSGTKIVAVLALYQKKIDASHKLSADYVDDGTDNKAYSATEKTKLAGAAEGAQVNVIDEVEVKEGMVNRSSLVDIEGKKAKLVVTADEEVAEMFAADRILYCEEELERGTVAFIYKDNLYGTLKYLPVQDIANRPNIDATRYFEKPFMRFHRGKNGRPVAMYKNAVTSKPWAIANLYKLQVNTTDGGSFSYSVKINDTNKTGTVTWEAGETLAQVAAKITGTNSYFTVTTVAGEDFIRVSCSSYNNTTFTLSEVVGDVVCIDLSKYCRVNGMQQSETHRSWQAQSVNTLFPTLGFLPANTKQYAINGYNLSYRCIGSLSRAKTYYETSGSGHGGVDTYLAETAVSARMSRVGFASCNNSGNADAQALYDKYNGSWDDYMSASRIKLDDTHTDGVEYKSYDNGDTQTSILVSITTMGFDGNYTCAYPAAFAARSITDVDLGACNMPTNHEIGVFMDDQTLYDINLGMYALGGTSISITAYYWSVAEYSSINSWFYHGTTGCVNYHHKVNSLSGRALVYLD